MRNDSLDSRHWWIDRWSFQLQWILIIEQENVSAVVRDRYQEPRPMSCYRTGTSRKDDCAFPFFLFFSPHFKRISTVYRSIETGIGRIFRLLCRLYVYRFTPPFFLGACKWTAPLLFFIGFPDPAIESFTISPPNSMTDGRYSTSFPVCFHWPTSANLVALFYIYRHINSINSHFIPIAFVGSRAVELINRIHRNNYDS